MKRINYLLSIFIAFTCLFPCEFLYAGETRGDQSKVKLLDLDRDNETRIKLNREEFIPKLISSVSIRVDVKNEISYIKNAKMEIYGGVLLAEELTYDQKNKTIITTTASFTDKNGKVISRDAITFDYGRGTYIVKAPFGTINPTNKKTALVNVDQIEYIATDSIRTDKLTGNIYLYGNATVSDENMIYKGDRIVYNNKR